MRSATSELAPTHFCAVTACILAVFVSIAGCREEAGEPLAASALDVRAVAATAQRPPNILLIIADDVGIDQIGAYGADDGVSRTPNIDALAARGVLFRNVWSNPVCSSTRATVLTGRYGFRTGVGFVVRTGEDLQDREHTLAELLVRHPIAPYRTAAFGKWHLSAGQSWETDARILSAPYRAGFQMFRGVFKNIVRDYTKWREIIVRGSAPDAAVVEGGAFNREYNTRAIVDHAAAWIREAESSRPEAPWFVWLAFNAANRPFHKPPRDLHRQDLDDPALTCANPPPFATPENLTPCYHAMIEAMDSQIGRLLDRELSDASRAQTVVVFVSDNGSVKEAMGDARLAGHAKGTPYEGGIHEPLVIAGRGIEAQGGRESEALVNTSDLFATVLELAGIDVASHVPGQLGMPPARLGSERSSGEALVLDSISLVRLLAKKQAGDERHDREFAYAELFKRGPVDPRYPVARTLRDVRGFKLIHFLEPRAGQGQQELYDLTKDPSEQRNLLGAGLDQDAASALERLRGRLATIETTGWRPEGPPLESLSAANDRARTRSE